MQSFLRAALAITVFTFAVAALSTKAGKSSSPAESVVSLPRIKDSALFKSSISGKAACFGVEHPAPVKYKTNTAAAGLTLEYFAVQLPVSYSFQ